MSSHPDQARIESRARLEPEEVKAGSADPTRQAEVILEDSDERIDELMGAVGRLVRR